MKINLGDKINIRSIPKLRMLNKKVRIGLIILSGIILVSLISFLFITEKYQKMIDKKFPLFLYNNNAKLNYKVALKPNILYVQNSLDEGNTYITDFVDSINMVMSYKFDGERPSEVLGRYKVAAYVEGFLQGEKASQSIWKREYVLQPETNFSGNTKTVTVQKDIPVKLEQYNELVRQLSKATNTNFDTRLTVMWNISVEARTDKGVVTEQLSPSMEIPLNTKTFQIKGNLAQEKKGAIEETRNVISPSYETKVKLSYIAMGFCTLFLLFIILLTSPAPEISPLQKKLKKILKEHGNRIVALNNELAATREDVIEVASVEDLVRLSDDTGKPILYKKDTNPENEPLFYIIDINTLYVFKLIGNTTVDIEVD